MFLQKSKWSSLHETLLLKKFWNLKSWLPCLTTPDLKVESVSPFFFFFFFFFQQPKILSYWSSKILQSNWPWPNWWFLGVPHPNQQKDLIKLLRLKGISIHMQNKWIQSISWDTGVWKILQFAYFSAFWVLKQNQEFY